MKAIVEAEWRILGLSLCIPIYELDRIELNCHTVMDCHRCMLQYWLTTGSASWAALVDALRSQLVSMHSLANTIAEQHPSKLK